MHSLPPSATVRQRPPGARFGGGLAARRCCCSNAVGERPRPRRPSAVVDFVAAGAPAVVLAAAGGEPSRPRRPPVLAGLQACMAVRRALWAPRSVLFRGLAGAWQTSWYIDGRVASRRSALSPLGPSNLLDAWEAASHRRPPTGAAQRGIAGAARAGVGLLSYGPPLTASSAGARRGEPPREKQRLLLLLLPLPSPPPSAPLRFTIPASLRGAASIRRAACRCFVSSM